MGREAFYGITDQTKAARHRLDDARALFQLSRWRGCMYLAGYSIECVLKAKLMRKFSCRHLSALEVELQRKGLLSSHQTVFSHQLERLLRLTGRMNALRQEADLWRSFNIANRWVPAWRYNTNLSSEEDAFDYLEAVTSVNQWIENNV